MQDVLEYDKKEDYPKDLVYNFQRIRIEAETSARKRKSIDKKEEINLLDIYLNIANDYLLTQEQVNSLMRLEENIELEYSFPINKTIDYLKKIIKSNKKVIFISDMYLSADIVRKMLVKVDKDFISIPLYVSSEWNATKSSGTLFKLIAEKEKIRYSDWTHIGDNDYSDVFIPNKLGIKTKHINYMQNDALMRYFDAKFQANSLAQIYGGCTKIALMNTSGLNYNIGCKFGAPLLLGYAEWIIDLSSRKNIKEIYFVARDGYIVKRICDMIINVRAYNISTKYIYGSRKAFTNTDQEQIQLLKEYINQEINLNQSMLLFVDSFGIGKSIEELGKIIKSISSIDISSTHIKRTKYDYSKDITIKCEYANRIDIWYNIEIISSAPEGSCQGYQKDSKGHVVPKLEDNMTQKLNKYGYFDYITGIDNFVKVYLTLDIAKHTGNTLDILNEYVNCLNLFPSDELITFLINYPEKKQGKIFKLIRKLELKIKRYKYLIRLLEKKKIFNLVRY